jgi:hypothetical protein
VLDENVNGTVAANAAISSGTYLVSSNGRGTATIVAANHSYSLAFYLSGPGTAVVQEIDSGRTSNGLLVQQQSTAFSLTSLKGSYAVQATGLSSTSAQTITGQVSADGAGAISSGNLDINTAGTPVSESVSGTYAAPAVNGRATLTLNPSTDNRNFAVYIVNSTQAFVVGIDAGRLASGAMYLRF